MPVRAYSDVFVLILKQSSELKWINIKALIKEIWNLSKVYVSISPHCSDLCFFLFTFSLKSSVKDSIILK